MGIDDAPFTFEDRSCALIGVVVRTPSYVEAVLRRDITVDGDDATATVIAMINESRYRDGLKLIMIDGGAVGGFNVIDIEAVWRGTGIPVLTVTRAQPDFDGIKRALQAKFDDWEQRWHTIENGALVALPTDHNPIYTKRFGMDERTVKQLVERTTIRGALPEPIRLAHIIAAGITTGESYGRA